MIGLAALIFVIQLKLLTVGFYKDMLLYLAAQILPTM